MPTYDYECSECNHAFEEFHSMKENRKKCPECGKPKLKRLIGAGGGVIFKGPGFYETENRSQKYIKDKQYDNRQARKSERLSRSKDLTKTQTVTQLD
jgi:putative FmdB family regulatory protein